MTASAEPPEPEPAEPAEPDVIALPRSLRDAALRVLAVRGVRNGAGVAYWPDHTANGPANEPAPPFQLTHYPSCPSDPSDPSGPRFQRVLVFVGTGAPVLHVAWANGAMIAPRKPGVAPTRGDWLRVKRFERGAWEAELRALDQSL